MSAVETVSGGDRLTARILGLLVVFFAISALLGWAFSIVMLTSVCSGCTQMKANTAAGLVAAGLSLILATFRVPVRSVSAALGLTVSLFGSLLMAEYVSGYELGIDNLLLHSASSLLPTRPSAASAANFILIGLALALIAARSQKAHALRLALAVGCILNSLMLVLAYFISPLAPLVMHFWFGQAIHTAASFAMLALGVLATGSHAKRRPRMVDFFIGIAALVVLAALVASSLINFEAQKRSQSQLMHSIVMNDVLLRLLSLLQDAETSQRGYLLTGSEIYLEPYNSGRDKIDATVLQLDGLKAEYPHAAQYATRSKVLIARKMAELQQTIDLRRAGNMPAALAIVNTDEGKRLMDQLRTVIGTMQKEEDRKIETFAASARRQETQLQFTTIITVTLIVALVFLFMDGLRRFLELRRLKQSLVIANDDLDRKVAAKTADLAIALDEAIRVLASEKQALATAKTAEQNMLLSKFEAERANSAKTNFLATMSHEIRTPMNGVIGMVELLESTQLSATQHHYVKTIRQSGQALVELIDDILDYTKLEAGQLELERREFSLLSLLENVLDLMEPVASRNNLRMEIAINGDFSAQVCGDPTRLRQVLLNLTDNALKFTESGHVALHLVKMSDNRVRFEVHDTGIGVAEKNHDRLFQVFSQTDSSITRKFGGSGLGLAICKRMVDAMGGQIFVDSAPGAGSLFWFEIPLELTATVLPPSGSRKRAALMCSVERGRASAITILAGSGFDIADPETAEWIFVDAELAKSVSITSGETTTKMVAFGAKPDLDEIRFAAVIDGALSPGRLHRMVESLEHPGLSQKAFRQSGDKSTQHLKILVVDDTKTNQLVLCGLLRLILDHEIATADNGLVAVQMVERSDYDLIFMDVQMPEMDGLEATRCIRAMSGGKALVRIVAVTASAFASEVEACRIAGMDDFVSKPVTSRKVAAILDRTCPAFYRLP